MLNDRYESTSDAGNARSHRADEQCDGAHCPRSVSMVDILHSGYNWRCGATINRACDVVGYLRRAASLSGNCRRICGNLKAVSWHRIKLLLRRTSISIER